MVFDMTHPCPRFAALISRYCLILCLLAFVMDTHAEQLNDKKVIGLYEVVSILPDDLQFKAKVDTGATNSSMHATEVSIYRQGTKKYVRFNTIDSNDKSVTISLPLHREAKIKRHNQKSQARAVVILGVCLGTVYKRVEVTLADRSRFTFPFLVGASFLKGEFVVDVASQYMNKANCNSSS